MSRGISSSQRNIMLAIQNCDDPTKGISRREIDILLGCAAPCTSPFHQEYAVTNRTMLRLQKAGLVRCTKWCKTWGNHEFDTQRYFTLTPKGLDSISIPLRDAATRSREYRKRKSVVSTSGRQAWLADVMLFSRRLQCQ